MSPTTQAPTQSVALITAEQYLAMPDDGRRTELVRGRIADVPPTFFRHGHICANIVAVLKEFVNRHQLGWVIGNDAGVITERDPDTVRGPDVAYFSYVRQPKDRMPAGYPPVAPELVFEVLSPSDRKSAMTAKVGEYHLAGALVVCVLDPDAGILAVYPQEELPRRYTADEELTLPEVLPDFRIPIRQLFE
jgi:Uma2 family endonuclease